MTAAGAAPGAATTGAGVVQGPAAPTHTDLIWATASSQAALDDPHAAPQTRLAVLEAEAATYTAAAHLGVGGATAGEYAADPDVPIPYTLTPLAEAYLDGVQAEAADPEPEAGL